MAEHKDVYYADSSVPMSAGDISYAEAVSVGDKVEEIQYDSPIVVDNVMSRSLEFPNPVQGDACWRTDLGVEQRYYTAYNSRKNPGGKTTEGWYATTSVIRPIIPSAVSVTGTGSSYDLNEIGEISFTNALQVVVNDSFFYDDVSNFSSYKVILDITGTSGTYSYPVWTFYRNGGVLPTVTYAASWQGVSASANSGNTWSHPTVVPASIPNVGIYNCSMELNLEQEMGLLGSSSNLFIGFNSQSWSYTTASNNSLHMLSGGVPTTTRPNGFRLGTANGLMPMTGTMKFYGIG